MFPFIEELDKIAEQARELIASDNFKKAASLARKLDRSMYSEGWVHASKLFALLSIKQGDFDKAKEKAIDSLCNAWGDVELLEICRAGNEPPNTRTRAFEISVSTDAPMTSLLSIVGPDCIVTFFVVADCEFEAMRFIKDITRTESSFNPKVVSIREGVLDFEVDFKGVYGMSTFN